MEAAWMRLLKLVRRSKGPMILTTSLGLLASVSFIPVAFLLRRMFNVAVPQHDQTQIVLLGVAIAGLGLLGAAIAMAAQRVGARTARSVIADLRRDLLRRVYAHPASWHDRQDPGVLQLTIVQHTERVSELLTQLTAQALPSALLAVALSVATVFLSPLLTLCVVIAAPFYVLAGWMLGGRSRRRYRRWLSAHLRFDASVRTGLRTLGLTRVHGAEEWELARREERIAEIIEQSRRYDEARASYDAALAAIGGVAAVAPLVVGGLLVADGKISIGTLLAFYSLGLVALRATSAAVAGVSKAAISSEALSEIDALTAEQPPPVRGGVVPEPFTGHVAFDRIEFSYDGIPVLRDVSFTVDSGEHVALMGPSGAGKTTIASLLLGLYEPQRGQILIDGRPLEQIDVIGLRRQIAVVMQDTVVFSGTIRQNIAYGRDGCDENAIRHAADLAGLSDLIAELPDGYEYEVGEEGGLLSGGQRQRIGLARALMGDPRMLVLDEPTLNLDRHAIGELLTTLDGLDVTIIVITHDPDVASRADRVILVRDGMIGHEDAHAGVLVAG